MRRFASFMTYSMAALLTIALVIPVALAGEGKAKEDRLSGRVVMVSAETATITIQHDNVRRSIVYTDQTKFTVRNRPGALTDVKEGLRAICLGKFDEKGRLVATRVDMREE